MNVVFLSFSFDVELDICDTHERFDRVPALSKMQNFLTIHEFSKIITNFTVHAMKRKAHYCLNRYHNYFQYGFSYIFIMK